MKQLLAIITLLALTACGKPTGQLKARIDRNDLVDLTELTDVAETPFNSFRFDGGKLGHLTELPQLQNDTIVVSVITATNFKVDLDFIAGPDTWTTEDDVWKLSEPAFHLTSLELFSSTNCQPDTSLGVIAPTINNSPEVIIALNDEVLMKDKTFVPTDFNRTAVNSYTYIQDYIIVCETNDTHFNTVATDEFMSTYSSFIPNDETISGWSSNNRVLEAELVEIK